MKPTLALRSFLFGSTLLVATPMLHATAFFWDGDVIPGGNTTAVSLGNGTLDAATIDDTAGTLDAAGAVTINLGSCANLAFANSSGLTSTQLAHISASGFHTFALNSTGYLTAIAVVPYGTWKTTHAPSGTVTDDFDSDGVANAIEYILGGTATTNDIAKLPKVSSAGGNMIFTFIRDQASIGGVASVEIQVGATLTDWPVSYPVPSMAATAIPGVAVAKNVPSIGKDNETLTLPLVSDATTFARLKVSL